VSTKLTVLAAAAASLHSNMSDVVMTSLITEQSW